MTITQQIAKHFREVYFGGNWTTSHLKEHLFDVTAEEATTKLHSLNTIAVLMYHIHYYVRLVTKVLEGGALEGNDKFSFDHPPVESEEDWRHFLEKVYEEGEAFAVLVEQLPDSRLSEYIAEEKYGIFYRNLHGIIEHTHYHLGQIVLVKKLLRDPASGALRK